MSSRTNPFHELERLLNRLNRQLENASVWTPGGWNQSWSGDAEIAMDLIEEPGQFVVTVDVPGHERNEIAVRVTERTLLIEAEHHEDPEEGDETYLRRERGQRSQSRSIDFPTEVNADAVTARLKNGVLTVTVPKAEPTREIQHVEIKEAD